MSGDAVRMNDELLLLAQGTLPSTREWMTEIHLAKTPLTGSHNKPLVCNSAELLYARLQHRPSRVAEVLDWWAWYVGHAPICGGESLTPEEVYRAMMVYASFISAAVAKVEGHPVAQTLSDYTRAHVAWLALGAGAGPGRVVRDHHLADPGKPCILIGDGPAISSLPYIAQAGARGWIRNRDGEPQTFHFTESVGLSAIVGQAAAFNVPRKGVAWQVDIFEAACKLSPGIAPLGFGDSDRVVLREFLRMPHQIENATKVVAWVAKYPPAQPHAFLRYADGSVVTYMGRSIGSSTDPRMIDCWIAGGKTVKTSADDGLRASSEPQEAWETTEDIRCRPVAGGEQMVVQKPAVAESYRVVSADGAVTLSSHRPVTLPNPIPPPPVVPPKKKWECPCRKLWRRLRGRK